MKPTSTLIIIIVLWCMLASVGGSAQLEVNGTMEWLSGSMRVFAGVAAPEVLDANVVERGTFESPYYNQPRDFRSIRGTAIFSVFTSTICGHASTAALATRPMTIMNACKPPIFESQPVSQLPLVFSLTDSSLGYYLSNAALNGPFLLGLAMLGLLITAFGMQVFNKSFSVSMALVRFPGFLGAPAVFLGHQAITASMTIFTTSTSTGGEMIAGFVAVGFFGLLIPLHLILTLKMLPKYTKYVISFRSVSGTAYAQRRLAEVVQQFHEKLKEEEAARLAKEQERIKREERMSMAGGGEDLDEEADAGSLAGLRQSAAFSAVMSSAGLLGSVAKSFVTNMFTSESNMFSWEGGVDGMNEERLRQIRNATFSSILEEELRLADEEETAFSLIMVGANRWEDIEEGEDTLTEHDLVQKGYVKQRNVLVCNRHPAKQKLENDDANGENDRIRTKVRAGPPIRNGFVRMFGILFERYRLGYQWFFSVEMFVSFGCGILTGWRPADGSSSSCYSQAALILVLFALYLGLLVATRPYISRFEGALNLIVAGLCFVASVLFIMGLSVGYWAHVGAYLLAVMSVYVLILKALLDLYDTIFQHFRKVKQPWAPIEELTRHYMDLDREVARGKILTQSVFSLRTEEDARQMEVLGQSDSDNDYGSDMGGAGSEEEMARHDTGVRVVRRLVNEEDEGLYHQIGGRHKAFVSSRGVPVSLLPFAMEPIPDRITLPGRNSNTEDRLKLFERQLMKEAKKRRLAQQLLMLNDGEGNLVDLMGMDQIDLEVAVEQGKRARERKDEAAGHNRSANNFASRMGDVADMIEKEHRRNEDKDELRKTALRARTGITDEGRIQMMLDDGKYYDDEPVDYSNLLLNTYNFGDTDASILKRAPPRPDLYPAIAPSPPSSPTSSRRVIRTISPHKLAAASSTSTAPRTPADIAGTVLQNLLAAKKSKLPAPQPTSAPVRAPAKKQPHNFGWDL